MPSWLQYKSPAVDPGSLTADNLTGAAKREYERPHFQPVNLPGPISNQRYGIFSIPQFDPSALTPDQLIGRARMEYDRPHFQAIGSPSSAAGSPQNPATAYLDFLRNQGPTSNMIPSKPVDPAVYQDWLKSSFNFDKSTNPNALTPPVPGTPQEWSPATLGGTNPSQPDMTTQSNPALQSISDNWASLWQ